MRRTHADFPGQMSGDPGELLAQHKVLFSAGFTWSPGPDEKRSFRSEYYTTEEDADAATVKALRELGYKTPRWWEYWRWGEPRPSERVLAALEP